MPGPLTFPAPDLFPDLGAWWRQRRHPVWNANGRQVGSYETLDALCQGQWLLLTGEVQPPPSQLYISDFWGKRIPLSTQCVRAAKATAKGGVMGPLARIVQPQPVAPASAAKAVTDANVAATGSAAPINPDTIIPQGGVSIAGLHLSAEQTRLALYGVATVVGLSLIMGDGGRRRR
jgi:hypothetical protein